MLFSNGSHIYLVLLIQQMYQYQLKQKSEKMLAFASFVLILDHGLFIQQSKAEYTCEIEKYYPCVCEGIELDGRNYIQCNTVEVAVIMDVFNRTNTIELAEIKIYQNWIDNLVPANFLSNKIVGKILFDCRYALKTRMDQDSFNSTRPDTTIVELYRCNLEDSDFSFIEGFTKMTSLIIESFGEMGRLFATFPTNLPKINNIKLLQCFGWATLMNAPSTIIGAINFIRLDVANSADMTDDIMYVVIEWAVQSFNSTLKSLYIHSNNLKRIPSQIEFFGKITTLDIKNNFFPRILAGSLKFTSNDLTSIDISNCGIQEIEPNAFEGIFEFTFIDLGSNFLTNLNSSVFEEILVSGGTIDVLNNPLDCIEDPCHLAWIFNQNLLQSVFNAACSNGTVLKDLDPEFFADCFIVSTIEVSTPQFITSKSPNPETAEFTSTITSLINFDQYSTSQSPVTTYYTSIEESTLVSTIVSTISLSTEQPNYQPKSFDVATSTPLSCQERTTINGAQKLNWYFMVSTTILMTYLVI